MEASRMEIAKMQAQAATDFSLILSGAGISSAIAQTASENGDDLVVIGRGKVQKTLGRFQTHAYEIIRHAPCPVLSYSLNQQDRISVSGSRERPTQVVLSSEETK